MEYSTSLCKSLRAINVKCLEQWLEKHRRLLLQVIYSDYKNDDDDCVLVNKVALKDRKTNVLKFYSI